MIFMSANLRRLYALTQTPEYQAASPGKRRRMRYRSCIHWHQTRRWRGEGPEMAKPDQWRHFADVLAGGPWRWS